MPKIDFSFSGYVRSAEIETAANAAGKGVDVHKLSSRQLAEKLVRGELSISLGDYLDASRKSEIEIFEFLPSDE